MSRSGLSRSRCGPRPATRARYPAQWRQAALGEVRRAKSEAKRPLRTEVLRATVTDTAERIAVLESVADDVRAAGRITELVTSEGSEFSVRAELAPEAAA